MGPAQPFLGMRRAVSHCHAWKVPDALGQCGDRSGSRPGRVGAGNERERGMAVVG